MRQILLTNEEQAYLEDRYQHGVNQIERRRSHCLLLSNQGFAIKSLMKIFQVRYATVLDWFNNWEREGRESISIKAGRGMKKKLSEIGSQELKVRLERHRRNLKGFIAEIKEVYKLEVSKRTVQRFLKTSRLHFSPDPPQPQTKAGRTGL
jgi:transposase